MFVTFIFIPAIYRQFSFFSRDCRLHLWKKLMFIRSWLYVFVYIPMYWDPAQFNLPSIVISLFRHSSPCSFSSHIIGKVLFWAKISRYLKMSWYSCMGFHIFISWSSVRNYSFPYILNKLISIHHSSVNVRKALT